MYKNRRQWRVFSCLHRIDFLDVEAHALENRVSHLSEDESANRSWQNFVAFYDVYHDLLQVREGRIQDETLNFFGEV